nr:MAG TPA: hypothetical protein [Siphoviridae sp. ctoof1]
MPFLQLSIYSVSVNVNRKLAKTKFYFIQNRSYSYV